MLGSVTPEGNLLFNTIDTSSFQLRISQGGLLKGPRNEAETRLRPYSDATGQLNQPLTLARLSRGPIGQGGQARPAHGNRRGIHLFPIQWQTGSPLSLPDQTNPSGTSRAMGGERWAPDAVGAFAAQDPGRDFGVAQDGCPVGPTASDNEAVLAALGSAAGQPLLIC